MIKKEPHSTVYLRRDEEKYVLKAGLHATCKVNSSNTKKSGLTYYFGLSIRQRNATYKLNRVN